MKILSYILSILLAHWLLGQQKITGYVKDADGGIPGATVQLVGSENIVVTDGSGKFTLEVPDDSPHSIEIRSVGFKTVRKNIENDSNSLNITLEETSLTMDEVVVTGTMQPTFVSQSPVKIDVITSDHLNTYIPAASSGIVEGISLVNGIQEVVACGVCFTNSISINGLPGPYTAVLMDGTPIYGNLASVYGLNGIPSMIIDRFEVIKGPSSTLYGSEAVAGVINIITKDPKNQPTLSADVMGTTHWESFGNFSFAPKWGNSRGFVGVNYAYINNFDDRNGDGFGDNINMDRVSLFSKWDVFRPSGKKLTIAGKYYYEDRRNGVKEYLENRKYRTLRGSDEIYGESIYTNRLEVFGTYELPGVDNIKLDYSASAHRQNSYYGADFYEAKQDILFGNLIWQLPTTKHDLLVGLTSRYQVYDDNTVATETDGNTTPDKQFIPGLFVQDEWEISDKVTLLGGSRFDHYEDHGMIFSPRFNTKYKPGEWTTLRLNFGTGFRIVNLFTEDHAFVTGQRDVVIAETLEPEESYNFSFNFNHVYNLLNGQGMLDVDVFYTHFTNKITPDYDLSPNQIIYANTSGFAESKGIGLNIQHEFVFPLAFNLGVNLQKVTETENQKTRDIEFAPQWSGVFTANYRLPQHDFTFSYTANITGPMQLPTVYDLDQNGEPLSSPRPTTSQPFGIHNVQINHDFSNGISIYGGIQNLFDYVQPWSPLVGFNDPGSSRGFSDRFDTAYAYAPIHGRELYLGIRWTLD